MEIALLKILKHNLGKGLGKMEKKFSAKLKRRAKKIRTIMNTFAFGAE